MQNIKNIPTFLFQINRLLLAVLFLSLIYSFKPVSYSYSINTIEETKEGVIIIEGKYQERNIYIANAFGASGIGFCTYEVRVNGDLVLDEINSSAFEIDLANFNFKLGDDIIIEIRHKNGCSPKVLNPGSLKPTPTFETIDIKVREDGFLEWITKNEQGSLPYIIQQYKWNKWVDIGVVQGNGSSTLNNYAFFVDFNSGINKFRVIQLDQTGKIKKSTSAEIESSKQQLSFVFNRKTKDIVFSGETNFEIHDEYGNLVKKGFGTSTNISSITNGLYWLSYDNVTESFEKK
jgi:hypothetical protein